MREARSNIKQTNQKNWRLQTLMILKGSFSQSVNKDIKEKSTVFPEH